MQFDADTVGSASMAADAEICMMAADTMEELGIPRGSYVVKVNNRKVLDGVMEAVGLGGEENAGTRLTVLRAVDKLDRLGIQGVRLLLGPGRKDESGDFTKGAALNDAQIDRLLGFAAPSELLANTDVSRMNLHDAMLRIWKPVSDGGSIPDDRRDYLGPDEAHGFPGGEIYLDCAALIAKWSDLLSSSRIGTEGLDELSRVNSLVRAADYGSGRIEISSSVVRGLEYYTGPVYEVELTLPITGDDGKPVRFGSVGGGGRYDGLVSRFRGEPVPATGFSIGVSRLLAALMHLGKIEAQPEPGPVIVTVLDRDRLADYQRMAATLRAAGIRAELYLGAGKFGPQMKYADRRRSPCVVIQGSDEKQRGEVQIKDLIIGAELAGLSKERDDYLRRQAEAQFAVPEDRLVEAVRQVLARHGVTWG
jgi:histidyl-tRNA synthetase